MKKNIRTSVIIALFASVATFAADLDSIVLRIINSAGHRSDNIGFVLRRTRDGKELAAHNADRQFIPASLQKLFTAAAALDKLGLEYRAQTRIYADGFDRKTGEIKGDLYIVGAGDAGITAERLWLMAKHLRHAGVKSIPNRLIIDNSLFAIDHTDAPGYATNDNSRAFMAPISAFAVSFNSTSVVVQPMDEGDNAHIHLFPPRENVPVSGRVSTARSGRNLAVSTRQNPVSGMEIVLGGTIAPDARPRHVFRQVWEPVINAGESFRAVARQAGIEADFTIAVGKVDTSNTQLILVYDSEPMINSLVGKFKFSNNFSSEMMLLTLAAEMTKQPATWESATQFMENWWKETFPESGEISVINGSGMGDGNRSTAGQIADLLDWAYTQNWFFEYITTMAIAGVDGTLSSRFRRSDLAGNFRAKTGTLNSLGVSSLAGYFRVNGEMYTAVFIANDRATSQYAKWILSEQLLSGMKAAIERK
jgi:D-alanyl-D-alanine carboxypeptidase/D-alanyl-D-alanine-endopeptidase (penicillin-binding protein 4)